MVKQQAELLKSRRLANTIIGVCNATGMMGQIYGGSLC